MRAQKTTQRKRNRLHTAVTPTVSFSMAKSGQQLLPLPAEQTEVPSRQEKEPPVTEATKFPDISQVNALTVKKLYHISKV